MFLYLGGFVPVKFKVCVSVYRICPAGPGLLDWAVWEDVCGGGGSGEELVSAIGTQQEARYDWVRGR